MDKYRKYLGLRGAFFYFLLEKLNLKTIMRITIGNESLYIRTRTSDMAVAIRSLSSEEYGDIKCSNPSVVLDVGAHIGTSAIYFARRYPQARIIAMEPEAENYSLLVRNTEHIANIVPIKAALYGANCTRFLLDRNTGPWGYTVAETDNSNQPTGQKTECLSLSSLMSAYSVEHIDILKMDIEGSEKNVFESSKGWMDKVSIITAELHDRITPGCEKSFYDATIAFKKFEKHGEKITAYKEVPRGFC